MFKRQVCSFKAKQQTDGSPHTDTNDLSTEQLHLLGMGRRPHPPSPPLSLQAIFTFMTLVVNNAQKASLCICVLLGDRSDVMFALLGLASTSPCSSHGYKQQNSCSPFNVWLKLFGKKERKDRQTHRQTDQQTDRQADRKTDRQTDIQTVSQTDR